MQHDENISGFECFMHKMKTFLSEGQLSPLYRPSGTYMCTTACLHFAVACICGRIQTSDCQDAITRRNEIEHIMTLASKSHAGRGMISAFEAVRRMDAERLGLSVQEISCFFHPTGRRRTWERDIQSTPIQDLPAVLGSAVDELLKNKDKKCLAATVCAMVTCNSHTVCVTASCAEEGREKQLAFFDPMPSKLVTHMQQSDLVNLLKESFNLFSTRQEQMDVTMICKK